MHDTAIKDLKRLGCVAGVECWRRTRGSESRSEIVRVCLSGRFLPLVNFNFILTMNKNLIHHLMLYLLLGYAFRKLSSSLCARGETKNMKVIGEAPPRLSGPEGKWPRVHQTWPNMFATIYKLRAAASSLLPATISSQFRLSFPQASPSPILSFWCTSTIVGESTEGGLRPAVFPGKHSLLVFGHTPPPFLFQLRLRLRLLFPSVFVFCCYHLENHYWPYFFLIAELFARLPTMPHLHSGIYIYRSRGSCSSYIWVNSAH